MDFRWGGQVVNTVKKIPEEEGGGRRGLLKAPMNLISDIHHTNVAVSPALFKFSGSSIFAADFAGCAFCIHAHRLCEAPRGACALVVCEL